MSKYLKAIAAELNRPEVDDDALSVEEISDQFGMSQSWASKKAFAMVKAGKWERVAKWGNDRLVPAYRPVKK